MLLQFNRKFLVLSFWTHHKIKNFLGEVYLLDENRGHPGQGKLGSHASQGNHLGIPSVGQSLGWEPSQMSKY